MKKPIKIVTIILSTAAVLFILVNVLSFITNFYPVPVALEEMVSRYGNTKALEHNARSYRRIDSLELSSVTEIDENWLFQNTQRSGNHGLIVVGTRLIMISERPRMYAGQTVDNTDLGVYANFSDDFGKTWSKDFLVAKGVYSYYAGYSLEDKRIHVLIGNKVNEKWLYSDAVASIDCEEWTLGEISVQDSAVYSASKVLQKSQNLEIWLKSKRKVDSETPSKVVSPNLLLSEKVKVTSSFEILDVVGIAVNEQEKFLLWSDKRFAEVRNVVRSTCDRNPFGTPPCNVTEWNENGSVFLQYTNDGGATWGPHYLVSNKTNYRVVTATYDGSDIVVLVTQNGGSAQKYFWGKIPMVNVIK